PDKPWKSGSRRFDLLFAICYAGFAMLYLLYGLLPETAPDAITYHIGLVMEYYRHHGLVPITTSMYASMPQGLEMLFLFVYPFGRQNSGAAVHLLFLLTAPFGILWFGRRFGFERAGVAGALLFFMSPMVGRDGTTGYVDVALASVAFAGFYLAELWRMERDERLLLPLGLVTGFAMAIKYTG